MIDLFGKCKNQDGGSKPTSYTVYHDESKEDGYWHVFFFVPVASRDTLVSVLKEAHINSRFAGKDRSYKAIRQSPTGHNMVDYWLSILHASFQWKVGGGLLAFTTGRPVGGDYPNPQIICQFQKPLQCRIGIFYLPNGHKDLDLIDDPTRRIETTFRMGLQGACHFLFSAESPMMIRRIFIDREHHYRRPLDRRWIFRKLSERFRSYCSLHDECEIEGEEVSEDDRIILDAADILLGVVRYAYNHPGERPRSRKSAQARIIETLLEDIAKGQKRMRNSRLGVFATLSKAWLENSEWQFAPLAHDWNRRKEKEAALAVPELPLGIRS